MKRYYTDTEIKNALKSLPFICDISEQVNAHVTGYLDSKKIPHTTRKLDIGDYSAMIGDMTLKHSIVIEKKNGIDEIAGNSPRIGHDLRLSFLRAKADGIKVFFL